MRKMSVKETKKTQRKSTKLLPIAKSTIKGEKKKRNSKYKTSIERQDGKRKRNRESYHRRKVLKQVKPDFTDVNFNYDAVYQKRMFLGLKDNEYHVMVTLTNHDLVTMRKHNSNVTRFMDWLKKRGYVGNNFKINEKSGGNYHSHILLQLNVTVRSITGIIKRYWNEIYGYVDVLKIVGQPMKERVIKYMLKQLKPTSCCHGKQELIDTWELCPEPVVVEPQPDLFKNEAFLASVGMKKDVRCRRSPKLITFDIPPLKTGRKKNKTTTPIPDEMLGIY